VAATARKEIKPIDDYRGSAAYRLEVAEVLVKRALETAVKRARGEEVRR
jgi:CO/xanthine dehydrogenase FAD-binding subunit